MKKAFTLIELLVSLSIFSVVLISLYAAFQSGMFGFRRIGETIDTHQTARQIFDRIDLDLRNAVLFANDESKFSGSSNTLQFLSLVDSYAQGALSQEYASVTYRSEGNKVTRLARRNRESISTKSSGQPQEMTDIAQELTFSYIAFDDDSKEFKEQDSWAMTESATDEKSALPAAVKIRLLLSDAAEAFERTIYIPTTKIDE